MQKKQAFRKWGPFLARKAPALGARLTQPLLTCSTADVEEDSVPTSLTQLPNRLVQNFCSTCVYLEKGIWRDAKLQAKHFFKDVRFSVKELEGGLLVGAACHGASRAHKKQLLEGSREAADFHFHSWGARVQERMLLPPPISISCEPFNRIKEF